MVAIKIAEKIELKKKIYSRSSQRRCQVKFEEKQKHNTSFGFIHKVKQESIELKTISYIACSRNKRSGQNRNFIKTNFIVIDDLRSKIH